MVGTDAMMKGSTSLREECYILIATMLECQNG